MNEELKKLEADIRASVLPSYTYAGETFTHALLVLSGLYNTYAILDELACHEEINSYTQAEEFLPDGAHDGTSNHLAAVVTFKFVPELAHGNNSGGIVFVSEPAEYILSPDKFLPVSLVEAIRVRETGVSIWTRANQ